MKYLATAIGPFAMLLLIVPAARAANFEQLVQFDNVTPQRLYQLYLSSKAHSEFTNPGKQPTDHDYYPAEIDPREGGEFKAFINFPEPGKIGITGKILQLDDARHAKDQYVIVQVWRGGHERAFDLDSTLTLTFRKLPPLLDPAGNSAEIELVQANVPDDLLAITRSSWNARYWGPLREYLKANRQ